MVISTTLTVPHGPPFRQLGGDVPESSRGVSLLAHVPERWQTDAMSDLQTMPQVDLDTVTDEETETGEPTSAHIVKAGPGENGAALVLEARIMGTPIEALCGFVWVPSKDPKQLPVCQQCKDIYEMYKSFSDGVNRDVPVD
jgi:hypothetical protein